MYSSFAIFVLFCSLEVSELLNFGFVFFARREMAQVEGQDLLGLEGDISGGLALCCEILLPKSSPNTVQISSRIVAKSVGAGSGGFSR